MLDGDWSSDVCSSDLSYMNKSGVDRYSAYNKWGIDTADAVVQFMIKNHPDQRFLLTVNIGAIDAGGHNLGPDDYVKLIEDLDRDFYPLYRTASDNNIALFFTADHGMSFATKDAHRGGHSGDKYVSRQESLRIPLVILSPNAVSGVVSGEYRQEDLAPTLLSVLDLPDNLQYGDGKAINIKNYASIFVKPIQNTPFHYGTMAGNYLKTLIPNLFLQGCH
jgi:phosphopentomutase